MVKLLVAALSIAGLPGVALAQSDADVEQARQLWAEGRDLAEQGEWEAALDRFERSAALVDRASTVVSIANAAVRLERPERAIEALDHLAEIADPEDDAQLLEAGAQLRAVAEEQLAARPPPEPEPVLAPQPDPEPAPAGEADVLGAVLGPSIVLGAGVIAFVIAGGLFAAREDAIARREELCPDMLCPSVAVAEQAEAHHASADELTTGTNAAIVIGSLAAAAGATWLVLVLALDEGGATEVAVRPLPGGGTLGLEGTF